MESYCWQKELQAWRTHGHRGSAHPASSVSTAFAQETSKLFKYLSGFRREELEGEDGFLRLLGLGQLARDMHYAFLSGECVSSHDEFQLCRKGKELCSLFEEYCSQCVCLPFYTFTGRTHTRKVTR